MAVSVPVPAPVLVVGGGPAGLMAAERLCAAGHTVHLYDAMPTVGRKFLLAGIGGLNLTHAEPLAAFVDRYGPDPEACGRWLEALSPQGVRDWAAGLGIQTFVGSSQRVFPTDMKAAPLLRAWMHRLRHPTTGVPVVFHMRHRWTGVLEPTAGAGPGSGGYRLTFSTPTGTVNTEGSAVVLALGGASWPRLGSDGAWTEWLRTLGVTVQPLKPANCGFDVAIGESVGWSEHLVRRSAGQALKGVELSFIEPGGQLFRRRGECVLTQTGLEGSLIYAASARLREAIAAQGHVDVTLHLKPDWSDERLRAACAQPRGGKTLTHWLKGRIGLSEAPVALIHEWLHREKGHLGAPLNDAERLKQAIQALPLRFVAPRPIAEAISTAGGVALGALTDDLMVRARPGVFCAGEMLDWEAPTGGYLLTACLASGAVAARGVMSYLAE